MQRLFVYGLHRKGRAEHGLLEHARFLGVYRTSDPFPLVLAGPDRRPTLLSDRGAGHRVRGEVYELSDEVLAEVDRQIRRDDESFRVMIPVIPDGGTLPEAAWAYVRDPETDIEIHGAPMEEFVDGGQYVE